MKEINSFYNESSDHIPIINPFIMIIWMIKVKPNVPNKYPKSSNQVVNIFNLGFIPLIEASYFSLSLRSIKEKFNMLISIKNRKKS